MASIFSTKGRLKRKSYFLIFIGLSVLWLIINSFLMLWLPPTEGHTFFLSRLLVDFLALISFTPIMLRRIHDIHLPGYILIIFWLAIPFSIRNIVYLNQYFKAEIDPSLWLLATLTLVALFLTLILFFYRSYSKDNKWGKHQT